MSKTAKTYFVGTIICSIFSLKSYLIVYTSLSLPRQKTMVFNV